MKTRLSLSTMCRALALGGVCLFFLAYGTQTARAQGTTLTLLIKQPPDDPNHYCVGRSYSYEVWVRVTRPGEHELFRGPFFATTARVVLTSALAASDSKKLGEPGYELDYKPTKAGTDTVDISAAWDDALYKEMALATAKFAVKVTPCKYAVNLIDQGTYMLPAQGDSGVVTANEFGAMDQTIIQAGPDGKYAGTGEVLFGESLSGTVADCTFSTTPAEGTSKVDIPGELDDSGEVLSLNMAFQPFSATWTITGTCPEGVLSEISPPGNMDLNQFLGFTKFDVAAGGGSFEKTHTLGPRWNGEGTATVLVYPEQDQGTASFDGPDPRLVWRAFARRSSTWLGWHGAPENPPTAPFAWAKATTQ